MGMFLLEERERERERERGPMSPPVTINDGHANCLDRLV